jgi:glycosyltransferase involved in cell wall biosynthesis
MRILYHHRTRGRHVEGVHIRGVVGALRALGHEVRVLSFPGADPEREPEPTPAGAAPAGNGGLAGAVTRLPGVLFELAEIAYNLVTWWRIGALLRRAPPDLIYERYSLFLCATVWLAGRRGIPIVLEMNDSAVVERVRPLVLRGLARRIERWCLRRATGLVFISTRFRDLLAAEYGQLPPSVVSPNAVDERFDPSGYDRDRLRRERGLDGRVVCGHVGAFVPWHGVSAFIAAILKRLDEAPGLTLLLIGDGRELPAVRAEVEARGLAGRVHLPGRVGHEQIPGWLACMDYAVLPDSNEYGSPMKLFEKMAMAVAVVAPDYDPIAEVVDDGRTGWLFPRRRLDACVDTVLALARPDRADERARVGAAARDHIRAERQWRNNAQQLLALVADRTASR